MRRTDVDQMLRGMGWKGFLEWMAFTSTEPLGDRRMDALFAMLCAVLANINRDPKRRSKAFEPKDFMPQWGGPPAPTRKQTPKEQWANWMLILGDHAELLKQSKARRVKSRLEGAK